MKFVVNVVGLGKLGLPLAAVIANSGLIVYGVDIDSERVRKINQGGNPVSEEPGLSDLLKTCCGKNLIATTDAVNAAKKANVHIVAVPLFIDSHTKEPNFTHIDSAIDNIAKGLKIGDLVVIETTLPIGTTEGRIKNVLKKKTSLIAGTDFYLAFSPEYLMTGYAISRFQEFPKIIGGINEKSSLLCSEVYSYFCKEIRLVDNCKTAEMIKLIVGLYRDVNIALANEAYMICEQFGINFKTVRDKAQQKYVDIHETGNVGGHCIPLYPWFLINALPKSTKLIRMARQINDDMVKFFVSKIKEITSQGKILVLGLTFRSGVKETIYSQSFPLIKLLQENKYDVYVNDPLYSKEEIEKMGFKWGDAFEKMDGIIVMNKYPQFHTELLKIRAKVVDTKNTL